MPNTKSQDNEGILLREDRDGVALLTLNNPKVRNCLSDEMIDALREAIDDIAGSRSVKAAVLTHAGPVFCSGHDMKQLTAHRKDADGGKAYFKAVFGKSSELMRAIVHCPKPVIAAIHGTATAAGCQLVAACDLAIAGETAQFCTPGVNIGLFCSTPMVSLGRNIPRKRAMEMLLLGEMVGAREAADYGLVNRVVPADRVLGEAMSVAETIASKSSAAVAYGKAAFYRQLEKSLAEAYEMSSGIMAENMMHADADEGIGAFLEKRPAKWSDG